MRGEGCTLGTLVQESLERGVRENWFVPLVSFNSKRGPLFLIEHESKDFS